MMKNLLEMDTPKTPGVACFSVSLSGQDVCPHALAEKTAVKYGCFLSIQITRSLLVHAPEMDRVEDTCV